MNIIKKRKKSASSQRQPRFMQGQETNAFRRSRTLTGSKSSDVSAANERSGTLQSDRLKKQSLRRHQRLLLLGLGALGVIIGGLYYLLSQYVGSAQVVYGESTLMTRQPQTSVYSEAILRYLGTRPGERFRFALNTNDLTTAIAQKYPEVRAIKSVSGSIGKGNFEVSFRQPVVSWKIGVKQYFVDNSGETFETNFYATPVVSVRDNSGVSLTQGDTFVSKSFLRFLGRVVALTQETGTGQVVEATLPPNTTREIDIKLQGRGYVIKTHTDRDPAAVVQDMGRVMAYLDQRKTSASYIDVRVVGRAYYK